MSFGNLFSKLCTAGMVRVHDVARAARIEGAKVAPDVATATTPSDALSLVVPPHDNWGALTHCRAVDVIMQEAREAGGDATLPNGIKLGIF
ncbi:unnamed protein product [Zymoseptoria tritici ST99CH_1A5]|uniref:Uncharacterized protein n=1 Tax=Zymoseptoria tritici ST99CH_1A5 TaxID=1276529 RepID=A0A1Y6LS39_ZYMTR|nr:unnamed protein product [Zymoseptoria tritici ST99CH_1A5]